MKSSALLVLFIISLLSCSRGIKFDKDSVLNVEIGNQHLVKSEGSWFIEDRGYKYPAISQYIDGLLDSLNSGVISDKITDRRDLYHIYGVKVEPNIIFQSGSGKISLSLGDKIPGGLGRYLKFSDSDYIQVIEGSISEYSVNRNLKDLYIRSQFKSYTPVISGYMGPDKVYKIVDFQKLLRLEVVDLIPVDDRIPNYGKINIETDDGREYLITVKNRAGNYTLNFQAPYSYLITSEMFNSLF